MERVANWAHLSESAHESEREKKDRIKKKRGHSGGGCGRKRRSESGRCFRVPSRARLYT